MEFEVKESKTIPLKEQVENNNNLISKINSKYIYSLIIFCLLNIFLIIFYFRIGHTKPLLINKNKQYYMKEKHIDSNYERISSQDEKYIYIPIISTSDFHGHFFPENNEFMDNSKKVEYKTGGLEYTAKYINILRDEFGKNRVLYFDIGDQFFQTNETILFDGLNIIEFLNKIGLNGSVIGNHEFIYRRDWIENKIKKAKFPYITNNIKDKTTGQKNGILGKNQEQSHLYEIKLDKGDIIKIGVIGITLNNREDKELYTVGNRHTWNDIIFQPYETDLENESIKLRQEGADAIVLLAHIGMICDNESESSKLNMYNKKSKQCSCDINNKESLLNKLLNNLKPGIIDAIIGGDTHNTVHHWINNIPIMINKGKSNYLNVMYLPFKKDNKSNKYLLINDEIKIESPLPSCEKIFSNLNHCEKINIEEDKINPGELIEYYWHGKKIVSDEMTKDVFNKYYSLYNLSKESDVVKFIGFNNSINVDLTGDSLLGNIMMDAIRNITKADVSIVNFWMFQNSILPGRLNMLDFIKLMPHENYLCTTELTGGELIKMIQTVQSSERGYQPTSGLKQFIKINDNKKKEVINVQIYVDGKAIDIDKDKIYILSSNNLILSEESEDEFKWKDSLDIIQDKFRNNKIQCSRRLAYIDLMNYFRNIGVVDLSKDIDLAKPRIVIVEE